MKTVNVFTQRTNTWEKSTTKKTALGAETKNKTKQKKTKHQIRI